MSLKNGLLALLADGPRIGYQLKRDFEDLTVGQWPVNGGQIYTTLGRLIRDGLVEVADEPGSDDDQRRYRITTPGRAELDRWFNTPRPVSAIDRDELTIKVAMLLGLDIATAEETQAILDRQRAEAMSGLRGIVRRKTALDPSDPSDTARLAVLDATAARLDAELRWLGAIEERLTQHERLNPDNTERERP